MLGASGAGKSVILKLILGLFRPTGRIFVHGSRIDDMRERDLLKLRGDVGMLFQESALFDSLTWVGTSAIGCPRKCICHRRGQRTGRGRSRVRRSE
jgi:ABC-type transporter Mla maintaining outer membrane lipid asymmetry ATPase subunit MlaF